MSSKPAENADALTPLTTRAELQNDLPDAQADAHLVVIEPPTSRLNIRLRELWLYHELLYFLAWRDIKVRYKQTFLGAVWVILQPLSMMFIFSVVFGKLARVPSDGIPYPAFAFAGLLPWMFLSTAVTSSGNSVVNSANLITKVYFPRLLVPMASVGAALIDFIITFAVLAALLFYYDVSFSLNILMLPVLILLLVTLVLACGILTAALNVKYRDVRLILPFLIQVWFFASPIIYPSSILPERWRWILSINPVTGIIEGLRVTFFGHKNFNWMEIGLSTGITLLLLVYALITFKRMEKSFADII
jgi:lipopolysaccharide transport system permease protein